jgi:hypothetical protein
LEIHISNHNHKITNELHLRNQNLIELNLNNPKVNLVHIRNKTFDGSEQDMNQTQVFFPGYDYTSYKEIGGKSQILTARILRRRKSRPEFANHNYVIIASIKTGVDIRLASTSITNPHCKGQLSFGQTR